MQATQDGYIATGIIKMVPINCKSMHVPQVFLGTQKRACPLAYTKSYIYVPYTKGLSSSLLFPPPLFVDVSPTKRKWKHQ